MHRPTLQAIAHTYGYVVDIKKKKNTLVLGPNIGIKKESISLALIDYLMDIQSQNL